MPVHHSLETEGHAARAGADDVERAQREPGLLVPKLFAA
jgi:hypothetical protein